MNILRPARFTSIAVLLLSSGAKETRPQFHGKVLWNPVAGSSALYAMDVEGDETSKGTLEVGVLKKERVNGKDAFWIEYTKRSHGRQWVMKMLVTGDASNSQTLRWIFQMAGHPPMEMPMETASREFIATSAEDLGRESVSVPAGTFACEHYRVTNGSDDTWLSEKVVLWGIVKERSTYKGRPCTMTLLRTSTGAKDKVIGAPQPFDPKTYREFQTQP
jgi:hypothetical protein